MRKSLARYKDEIFPFLEYSDVEPDTHVVEQTIRLNVILCKITYGNNSPKGARNHEVIISLIQTTKANGQPPIAPLTLLQGNDDDKVRNLLYGNIDLQQNSEKFM